MLHSNSKVNLPLSCHRSRSTSTSSGSSISNWLPTQLAEARQKKLAINLRKGGKILQDPTLRSSGKELQQRSSSSRSRSTSTSNGSSISNWSGSGRDGSSGSSSGGSSTGGGSSSDSFGSRSVTTCLSSNEEHLVLQLHHQQLPWFWFGI